MTGLRYSLTTKAILMDGFRTLHDGQKVEYEVESSPKGPKGVRIKPLD